MKKSMFASYVSGIVETEHGESYGTLFRYLLPELITAFAIYSLPFLVDAWFIGQLSSTSAYATLGATNNFIHFVYKLSESFSVGTLIMSGKFNGQQAYARVGHAVRDAFWTTALIGLCFATFLYMSAFSIYQWYGVPAEIAQLGVPFLRLRAIGVFFIFISMALIGFLRGIKNTHIPMIAFMIGGAVFVLSDYLFIFGNWGAPALGLQGSALASVIQYGVMVLILLGYIGSQKEYRKYGIQLFSGITDFSYIRRLISLSFPIMIDKATMAWSYVWLCKMINPMGTCTIASFCALKDLERCAFLPAVACAQVITFLVSNDSGIQAWDAIKANIKKISLIASIMVGGIMLLFAMQPATIIQFFDKKGEFTSLAVRAFPIVSVLVLLDLIQLILAGALRGAGNVRVVMYTRLLVCLGFFAPLSYLLSTMQIHDTFLQFVLIYGSFYVGNALMSFIYIHRLRGQDWKVELVKGTV